MAAEPNDLEAVLLQQLADVEADLVNLKKQREDLRKVAQDADAALVNTNSRAMTDAKLWIAPVGTTTAFPDGSFAVRFSPRLHPAIDSLDGFIGGYLWLTLAVPASAPPTASDCAGLQRGVALAPGYVGNHVPLPGGLGALGGLTQPGQFNAAVYNQMLLHAEDRVARTVDCRLQLMLVQLAAVEEKAGLLHVVTVEGGDAPSPDALLVDVKIYHPEVEAV